MYCQLALEKGAGPFACCLPIYSYHGCLRSMILTLFVEFIFSTSVYHTIIKEYFRIGKIEGAHCTTWGLDQILYILSSTANATLFFPLSFQD